MTPYSDFSSRDVYRRLIAPGLACWYTQHKQTELFICADMPLKTEYSKTVIQLRSVLDKYILRHPEFLESFAPIEPMKDAPKIAKTMCVASKTAGVGPMASVAGAFAACVGQALLKKSQQVIVENGGDIFIKTDEPKTVAIFAGQSPLSLKMGIVADAVKAPLAVCTSAGTVGPSVSLGQADAAVVIAHDACLADACATRLGNEIRKPSDIKSALEMIVSISGVMGAVAIMHDVFGAAGDIELEPLSLTD